MLVFKRKLDAEIVIGDNIVIKVVGFGRNPASVYLGFTAPREIPIHRREVFDAIERELEREVKP